jgi:hypothetical protein
MGGGCGFGSGADLLGPTRNAGRAISATRVKIVHSTLDFLFTYYFEYCIYKIFT